jgi:hypothetical protein
MLENLPPDTDGTVSSQKRPDVAPPPAKAKVGSGRTVDGSTGSGDGAVVKMGVGGWENLSPQRDGLAC